MLTGFGIIGSNITANAIFSATVTNKDLAISHPGRTGNSVIAATIRQGIDLPDFCTGCGIQSNQATVKAGHVDPAFIDRYAAVDHVTTGFARPRAGHFWVIGPDCLTGDGIQRVDPAPGRCQKHHVIHDDGGRLQRTIALHILKPGQTEVRNAVFIDLLQRRETLLLVGTTIGQPVPRLTLGILDSLLIDHAHRGRYAVISAGCNGSGRACGRRFLRELIKSKSGCNNHDHNYQVSHHFSRLLNFFDSI